MMRRKHHYAIDFPSLRQAQRAENVVRTGRGPWLQWGTPKNCVWANAVLPMRDLAEPLRGLRVLHLTDLHLGRGWGAAHEELIARVAQDPPDLILFTGDFVENRFDHRVGLPNALRLFGALKARGGTYAIMGNHDPDVMLPYLAAAGIRFIAHQRVIAPTDRGDVELIGFPGLARQDLDRDFVKALPPRRVGQPRIVLSHYPDLFPAALKLDADLYLAGHTHGGQLCLPSGWPPVTHDQMPRKFAKGIHRIVPTWYAVGQGMGYTGIAARLFCPMEVTTIALERE